MKAVLDHSHELSPTKAMMLRVNKNTSMHVNRTIEINHEAKAVMNKTIQSLACDVGGYRNLLCSEGKTYNWKGR